MNSIITEGIEVSVETHYQPEYSNPGQSEFLFAYKIRIENHNHFTVKLLRRKWYIFDSNGTYRQVEGDGVLGVQPVIVPGQTYSYISGCNLTSEMGKMWGVYTMENHLNHKIFQVEIPSFEMYAPLKLN